MSDDEVERKILPLNPQAVGTNLPVLLLQELQDCLAVQITQTDVVGLGAQSRSDTVVTPFAPGLINSLIVAAFLADQSLTYLLQLLAAVCFMLFK